MADPAPRPGDPIPLDELTDVVTVVVGSVAGQPGKMSIEHKAAPVPRQVADENTSWHAARQELARELRRLHQDADAGARVRIAPAGGLRQEFVMAVYDVCRQAGYTQVDFVSPPLSRLVD